MNVVTDLSQRYDLDDQTTLIDQHAGSSSKKSPKAPATNAESQSELINILRNQRQMSM